MRSQQLFGLGSRLRTLSLALLSLSLSLALAINTPASAIPLDLPWSESDVGGQTVIVQPGIAAATCGTLLSALPAERFTFGMFNIDAAVPATGRVETTALSPVYHHPSWLVSEIGNVFGVAIQESTGDVFLSASSNFSAGFFGQTGVLNYGDIGGGPTDLCGGNCV